MSALALPRSWPLLEDEVQLWLADPKSVETHAAMGAQGMDADQRDRMLALQRPEDRQSFAGRQGLIRRWAANYAGLEPARLKFARRGQGKPCLEPALGLQYSASTSQGWVLAAFARDLAVGVDLELLRPGAFAPALVEAYFSRSEAAALKDAGPAGRDRKFLQLWARKEAVLKLSGLGLSGLASLGREGASSGLWVEDLSLGEGLVGAVALLRAPSSFQILIEEAA